MNIVPNMFRPALDKITSPIASTTANYGIFNRVLTFTGSFNDRTSLLLDADAELGPAPPERHPAPPAQAQEPAAPAPATTTAVHTFDIEAAAPLQATSDADEHGQETDAARDDAESKRVAKSVYTVCLFVASASLVLFGNLPGRVEAASKPAGAAAAAESGGALYIADLAFISLGFFSSLGLSMLSIVGRPGVPAVAAVQKWGMVTAVAAVLVAFTLRMAMMLPAASL